MRFDLRSTFLKMLAYALQDMHGHVAFVSLVSLCPHTFTAIGNMVSPIRVSRHSYFLHILVWMCLLLPE
jgi:hypothetical protein